jgi:hypothetical protein
MISTWSEWKRYPRPGRGGNIEAPITPGLFEVRIASTGALHSFEAVDNVALALAQLPVGSKSWFGRRETAELPDLEYRTARPPRRPRQGRRRTHDRPQRGGMSGARCCFRHSGMGRRIKPGSRTPGSCFARRARGCAAAAADAFRRYRYTRSKTSKKSEEHAMNPPVAARAAHASASSLHDRLKDPSLLRDRCYIDGAWVGRRPAVTNPVNGVELAKIPA